MVAHLYRYKMIVEAIEGFADFAATGVHPHVLAIAGNATDPAYANDIRRTIVTHGLEDRVWLLGSQPPSVLAGLYRQATAFVFASACENASSYAVIDALAYGLPVISSTLSSTPEIVGDATLTFDPRQPAQLAAQLKLLLESNDLAAELSARAHTRSRSLPAWGEIADEVVSFCSSVRG
jgi:glycosyltransferase involved in cell wall biosynthesis